LGLLDRIRSTFEKKQASNVVYDVGNVLMRAQGDQLKIGSKDSNSQLLTKLLKHGYIENPHGRTVNDYIAGKLSQIKPIVYIESDGGELEEVDEDDELSMLMKNPNENQTGVDFAHEAHSQYNILGNNFLYGLEPSGFNVFTKLYNMPAQQTAIVSGGWREPVKAYFLEIDGEQRAIEARFVAHRKQYNPLVEDSIKDMYGLSKMVSLVKTINRSNSAYDAGIAAFANGTPAGILSPETPNGRALTDTEVRMMEKAMKKRFGGGKNHGKIMRSSVGMKWTAMGLSPAELDLLNSNQFDLRDFCRVYGFSSVLVSDTSQSKHDIFTQAQREFWENVGIPQLNDYFWCLNKFVAQPYRDATGRNYKIWYDLKDIPALQESLNDKQARLLNELENNLITFGEYHKKMGQEVPDAPHMELYKLQLEALNTAEDAEDNEVL